MARAEHDPTGTSRPLVPSVDLSRAPLPAQEPAQEPVTPPGRVLLRLPADAAYLSVLRTTAAALAARLDVSVDEVDDVRIAVDEAASMLLQGVVPGSDGAAGAALEVSFELSARQLVVEVSGPARTLPERGGVAWSVLEALVGEVRTTHGPTGSTVRMVHALRGAP